MPIKKSEEDILTAEMLRFKRRLAKLKLDHLTISDLTVKDNSANLRCRTGFEPRMVKQSDGSFKLKCVPIPQVG